MDTAEAICWLKLLLDEAIKSEKADGVLLSGGLDTSIVALIAKKYVKRLKAFTVTLEGFDDDLKYARRVAQFLELDHKVHFFSERELLDAAAEAASILDNRRYDACVPAHIREGVREGYTEVVGPTTLAPVYIAMRFARNFVNSIYSGDGADELFIGYDSITSFIDFIASSGDEPLASDLEQELSSRVFQAYDLRYPYMLAFALGLELKAPYLCVKVSEFARKIPVDYKV
ncbi:MAG: hypothetical protein IBX36_06065, partial [Dehalococcoidia bacterium]|nr:hypothetical protein [Dehalococcoidia bacterium]